jgi:hypothetical protein
VLQEDYFGENLVEAPKMVDKAALQIGYAKTAKKVDMKRIKAVTWAILTQASSEVNSFTLLIYAVLEDYLPAVFFFFGTEFV